MATIPKRVLDRFIKKVGEYQKVLKMAKDKDINESDTVTIITDCLAEIFGFNKYTEITSEYCIRGTFCDLAAKADGSVKFLIEVKAIGVDLKTLHMRQAIGYGSQEGIQWVILTNGVIWKIYRIRFEKPVDFDEVCVIDLLSINPRKKGDQELLFLLCREAISSAVIEEYHDRISYVNRFTIGLSLLEEPTIDAIRKELRKLSPGLKVENEEIRSILTNEVIKRDILEGELSERAKCKMKNCAKKAARKPKEKAPSAVQPCEANEQQPSA